MNRAEVQNKTPRDRGGPGHRGISRTIKAYKRAEAETRNAATPYDRTRRAAKADGYNRWSAAPWWVSGGGVNP